MTLAGALVDPAAAPAALSIIPIVDTMPSLGRFFWACAATAPLVDAGIERRGTHAASNCPATDQAPVVHDPSTLARVYRGARSNLTAVASISRNQPTLALRGP
jgi:hypothetical protein